MNESMVPEGEILPPPDSETPPQPYAGIDGSLISTKEAAFCMGLTRRRVNQLCEGEYIIAGRIGKQWAVKWPIEWLKEVRTYKHGEATGENNEES